MGSNHFERIADLPCWQGEIDIEALDGGMTNLNFKVVDGDQSYVVRMGEDDPIHLISRSNEIASCQAAFEIGLSPELVHHQPGMLVVRFVEGKVLSEADVRSGKNLPRITDLLKTFHRQMPLKFQQIPIMFWVFQVLRHYQTLLRNADSRHRPVLGKLADCADILERAVGPVDIVFGHNDLLAANFIDDGTKIWLIDFDYAGFNSPLFDLANLAANNELDQVQEQRMLEQYFAEPIGEPLVNRYYAMKCASALRETLWSMVSENHSRVAMDFAEYTQTNLTRFEAVYAEFSQNWRT
ncbi:MAG: thiamine kinase-like enzyme [Planctomycetota bacterium]|jgi:thiamine kinase-like enzyme